jgi:hypothetical protein
MISDEVGAFIILRNYLVGTQFYSLSLQTKSAVFFFETAKALQHILLDDRK